MRPEADRASPHRHQETPATPRHPQPRPETGAKARARARPGGPQPPGPVVEVHGAAATETDPGPTQPTIRAPAIRRPMTAPRHRLVPRSRGPRPAPVPSRYRPGRTATLSPNCPIGTGRTDPRRRPPRRRWCESLRSVTLAPRSETPGQRHSRPPLVRLLAGRTLRPSASVVEVGEAKVARPRGPALEALPRRPAQTAPAPSLPSNRGRSLVVRGAGKGAARRAVPR